MNAALKDYAAAGIRRAMPGDALWCARLLLMASHGMADAVFRELIPGQPTEQIIATHRIEPVGRPSSYANWWVAEGGHSDIAGGINAYPMKENFRPPREELLTEERIRVLRSMIELDAEANGTFFINILAVFPEYRHVGLGRRLIALAVQKARDVGAAAVSLTTFDDYTRLVAYYRDIVFSAVASRSDSAPRAPTIQAETHGCRTVKKRDVDARRTMNSNPQRVSGTNQISASGATDERVWQNRTAVTTNLMN